MYTTQRHHEVGFTLMELLVVVCICGVLFAGLRDGMQLAITTQKVQRTTLIVPEQFEVVDSVVRRLINNVSYPNNSSRNSIGNSATIQGKNDVLDMTTQLSWPRYGATIPVSVRLEVDHNGNLILLVLPKLNVLWRISPQVNRVVLAEGVERVELAYRSNIVSESEVWAPRWTASNPPIMVRIRIFLKDHKLPRWPDIIAAPRAPITVGYTSIFGVRHAA